MRVLFDTSIVIAAHLTSHPGFLKADAVYARHTQNPKDECYISQHSIAELYCNLTRLPLGSPLKPADARILMENYILKSLKLVDLNSFDYLEIIKRSAALGVRSATIYDALIAFCAEKINADILYTTNSRHFQLVWPAGATKILEP